MATKIIVKKKKKAPKGATKVVIGRKKPRLKKGIVVRKKV